MASRGCVEDMDAEVYGRSPGKNLTSFATAQNIPRPRWTFSGLKVTLLQYFCKSNLDHLVKVNYVKLQHEQDILRVYINEDDRREYIENEFEWMNLYLEEVRENKIFIPNDVHLNKKKELQEYVDKNNGQSDHCCLLHLSGDYRTCTLFAKKKYIEHYQQKLKHQIDNWMTDIQRSKPAPISYPHPHVSTVANGPKPTNVSWSYADSVRANPKGVSANYKGNATYRPSQQRHVASSSLDSPPLFSYKGLDVHTVHGSITKMKTNVDGVVNAANDRLDHIGGVALYIAGAAGEGMNHQCKEIMKKKGKIAVSENVVTAPGRMRCKGIIHAVGPKWVEYQDKQSCLNLLADTVENALLTAEKENYSDVAMPAISAGIYGIPKSLCAAMYIKGITQFCRKQKSLMYLTSLYIVDVNDDILKEIQKAYTNWNRDRKSIEPRELLKQGTFVRPGSSSMMLPKESATVIGQGNVTTYSRKGSTPSPDKQWTRGPDETIPGLMDKVRCYMTHDGSFCVKIYTGSITRVRNLDAIVCTADTSLSGFGPLSEAVAHAGGYIYKNSFSTEKQKFWPKAQQGQAFKCSPGDLAVKHVVHLVVEQLADTKSQSLLNYKNFILKGLHSLDGWQMRNAALPLIAGGFVVHETRDVQKMCEIWYKAVMEFYFKSGKGRSLREIHFVNRKPEITHEFVNCFNQHLLSIKTTPSGPAPSPGAGNGIKKSQNDQADNSSAKSPGAIPKANGVQSEKSRKNQRHAQSLFLPKSTSSNGVTNKKVCDDLDIQRTRGGMPKSHVRKELCEEEENMQLKERCMTQKPVVRKNIQKNVCAACDVELESDNVSRLPCGHSFCSIPCFIPMQSNPTCSICEEDNGAVAAESEDDVTCVICMDTITDQKKLSCGHVFCGDCIMQSMAHKPACPVCGKIFGQLEGDQPGDGKMTVTQNARHSLPGYEACGTIEIKYKFQDGIQQGNHPQPGKPYKGTERRAFLPDNREGQKVLRLLRKAFDSRLTFTIGSSRTTGQEDVVTWNDIHHKTKRDGGAAQFGYPDPTYLSRVQEELAAKGIKE